MLQILQIGQLNYQVWLPSQTYLVEPWKQEQDTRDQRPKGLGGQSASKLSPFLTCTSKVMTVLPHALVWGHVIKGAMETNKNPTQA